MSDAQFVRGTISDTFPRSVTALELQVIPNDLPVQSNGSIKRKPLPTMDSTVNTGGSHRPLQNAPARVGREQDQVTRQPELPVQAPLKTIFLQNKEGSPAATTATWVTEAPAAAAPVRSPVQPAYNESRPQMRSANSLNESAAAVSSQRPPLRHAQTVPQPTLDKVESSQMQRSLTFQPRLLDSVANGFDKRKSVSQLWSSSLETGRKLAKNKYVRASVKYTADLAMRAVVNEVISDVLSNENDSSNDSGQPSGDGGAGVMDQLWNGVVNGMTSSPTDLQTSQVDLSGLIDPGLAVPIQPSLDTVTSVSDIANTGGMMDLFQQQQAATVGLNMALQQQSMATAGIAQSATQQSQQVQSDMQFQASKTLDWGTDAAVPGIMANRYNSRAATSNGLAASSFQQQLANASAAV